LKKATWLVLITAAAIITLDQVIKYLVSRYLPLGGAWSPLPGPNPVFQIVYTANTGVAFGLFKNLGPVFIIIRLVVSVIILFYAWRLREDQRLIALALGLMLGGTIGNAIDGVRLGYVIDFFDVGIGTLRNASNLADWSIVLCVILLGIALLREDRKRKQGSAAADLETRPPA
jgi:signal peptidase II